MGTVAIKVGIVLWGTMALTVVTYAAPTQAFNSNRVHAQYQNGDFDKVIKELVAFEKSGRTCSYNDSIFFEKHLSVVYASNPATRELGRYHMHKLLDLAPAVELLDMFVGDEVDKIFEKVRKEHVLANTVEPSKLAKASVGARKQVRPVPAVQAARSGDSQYGSQKRVPKESLKESLKEPPKEPPKEITSQPPKPRPIEPAPVAIVKMPLPSLAEAPSLSIAETPSLESDTLPVWKQKGVWIGGSAALAVVAFALYYSGSPEETATKTYVVPATAAK